MKAHGGTAVAGPLSDSGALVFSGTQEAERTNMNMVTVVPLTSFIHGSINAHQDRAMQMDVNTARTLERKQLIRIQGNDELERGQQQRQAVAGTPAGKALDDGQGQPSSASPAAPASVTKSTLTLPASKSGAKAPPKSER